MEMAVSSTRDKLSNMPQGILENIFSRLSIRDVARTSVLSTKWRYKWISFPHLIFNDGCIPGSNGSLGHDKLVKIINHVLLVHRGPIRTFKISSSQLQTCSEINSWIFSLSLDSLIEFELQISKSEPHRVLPCLFFIKQLIHLKLVGCITIPPITIKGFSCLTTLDFQSVTLSDVTLKSLISACPQLEWLTLIDINGLVHIEISNPKLQNLRISGNFISMCLKDLRLLVYASLSIDFPPDPSGTCNFSNIFGSLPAIQELCLEGWFLQSLSISDVKRLLPCTYLHLKTISIELNVVDMNEILVAICLLNGSPNLQELKILLWHDWESAIVPVMDLQEAKDQLDSTFNKLRVVEISEFLGMEIDLVLVRFILANSPALETMYISHTIQDTRKVLTLLKELLRFKRASQQAEIVYLDPDPHQFSSS